MADDIAALLPTYDPFDPAHRRPPGSRPHSFPNLTMFD
jgi:hypothetical protein